MKIRFHLNRKSLKVISSNKYSHWKIQTKYSMQRVKMKKKVMHKKQMIFMNPNTS